MSEASELRREALRQLAQDGLVVESSDAHHTTSKWQFAMSRAAVHLYQRGDAGEDVRLPIALALVELYQGSLNDVQLAAYIDAMASIEAA